MTDEQRLDREARMTDRLANVLGLVAHQIGEHDKAILITTTPGAQISIGDLIEMALATHRGHRAEFPLI